MEMYDLIVKGGRVIDPMTGTNRRADVGLRDGRIVQVAPEIPADHGREVVALRGEIVVPGLIDLHAHVYWGATPLGVNADEIGPRSGVTTWVDVGSTGAANFPGLYHHVIKRSRVRIVPFLHISYIGLASIGHLRVPFGELYDFRLADLDAAIRTASEYRGAIRGIKVRLSADATGQHDALALRLARAAADELDLPLMTHVSFAPPIIEDVLPALREGDILTHCFTPLRGGILTTKSRIKSIVLEARDRGVLFDVGHGSGSFSFATAEAALQQEFSPDCISTDIHTLNVHGPVWDLPTTMEKFLALGMPFEKVLECVTLAPARAIGMEGEIGGLAPGCRGDLAVLDVTDEARELVDVNGERRTAQKRIRVLKTFKDGTLIGGGE